MLPYIIEPDQLLAELTADNLVIVDLGSATEYQRGHVAGALSMSVGQIRLATPPAPGLLPDQHNLEQTLQSLGLTSDHHVIAYDHANNVNACRLLWTLEAAGHAGHSLLNGGMTAWTDAGFPTQPTANTSAIGTIKVVINAAVCADRTDVLRSLNNSHIKIIDARSPEEYNGLKSASLRKGHIPGAINLNWLDTIDVTNGRRFKPAAELLALLADRGVCKEDEIIVYCQTHQRSAHTFVMLKALGFNHVRGYAGSWSEWGNDPQLPITCPLLGD